MNQNSLSLRSGEIRLDLLQVDWPLTALNGNKAPYVQGWQNKPLTIKEIENEIAEGRCKAIGLMGGPVFNEPFGHIWVDVDGPTVYKLIETISQQTIDNALPTTLTICSGKKGRERKLYKINKENWKHLQRNKYVWHADGDGEKLEVLWSRHQGVLMGLHPETSGYYTKDGCDFSWVDKLPELPQWLLNNIISKNVQKGKPFEQTSRIVGSSFAINSRVSLEREMIRAKEALWALPPDAADDYDVWITIGQSLHALDDSMLDEWDEWSKQSDKYKQGECQRRWQSFSHGGGRTEASLFAMAKDYGWQESQNYKTMNVDDETLDAAERILMEMERGVGMPNNQPIKTTGIDPADMNKEQLTAWLEEKNIEQKNKDRKKKDKKEKGKRNPSSDSIAATLLTEYNGNLLYSKSHDQFFMYGAKGPGLWVGMMEIEIKTDIKNKLDGIKKSLLPRGYSINLINDLYQQLKLAVPFDDWSEDKNLLLFENGVLNIEERALMPFNKELYITQRLPYEYNPYSTCEPIIKWLKDTQDQDWSRVQVLRAWLRAVLLSCSDIQKFVEIVGPGKSGKSSYANLAHALVGDQNAMISSLEHLEKNRFETANIYKKKLLLFNDVERYGGSVSVLKALTGRDLIRNEQKYQSEKQKPFKFDGLVMITANEPIQTTDPTSGLARRRLTIPFNNPFRGSSKEQKVLIDMDDKGNAFGVFAPLLPGLVNWLLDMSHDDMREYLMETTKAVSFYSSYNTEQTLKSNPVMDWLHHYVVFDINACSSVGLAKLAPRDSSNIYANSDKWLYASYCEFMKNSNVNVLGRSRFESLVLDICNHQLGVNIYKHRNSRGTKLINIAVRNSNPKYETYPSIVEVGLNKDKYKEFYGDNVIDYKSPNEKIKEKNSNPEK
jgi:phage/plasmid-associated DNA primase